MHDWVCTTCGVQFAPTANAPPDCPICLDERQYVGWAGQAWTSHAELASKHQLKLGTDDDLFALALNPAFAINQRALLLPTSAGNILWECLSVVTPEGIDALEQRGGVGRIIISHPHFYSSMVEWSDALGGVPILLHCADREWVMRSSPRIHFWEGDELRLSADVTLLRCGGHFAGSTALHWTKTPWEGGALFPADAMQVAFDRRFVTFMYSYPNLIPMHVDDVLAVRERIAGLSFERIYGYSWGRNILADARARSDRSFERFLAQLSPCTAAA